MELDLDAAVSFLATQGYVQNRILGRGTFGAVIEVKHRRLLAKPVAVKVVSPTSTTREELDTWPKLRHPNILAVHAVERQPEFCLFFMPKLLATVKDLMAAEKLTLDPSAFDLTVTWMKDVLKGLRYLHDRGLAHFDLKADNVLVKEDLTAVLADFTFLGKSGEPTYNFGVPLPYCPPEGAAPPEDYPHVEGASLDVWTFGVLCLNTWTGHWYEGQIGKIENWRDSIYPSQYRSLQLGRFTSLLTSTFPRAKFQRLTYPLALNLMQSAMRYDPLKRPTVREIQSHGIWNGKKKGFCRLLEADCMWLPEMKPESRDLDETPLVQDPDGIPDPGSTDFRCRQEDSDPEIEKRNPGFEQVGLEDPISPMRDLEDGRKSPDPERKGSCDGWEEIDLGLGTPSPGLEQPESDEVQNPLERNLGGWIEFVEERESWRPVPEKLDLGRAESNPGFDKRHTGAEFQFREPCSENENFDKDREGSVASTTGHPVFEWSVDDRFPFVDDEVENEYVAWKTIPRRGSNSLLKEVATIPDPSDCNDILQSIGNSDCEANHASVPENETALDEPRAKEPKKTGLMKRVRLWFRTKMGLNKRR